MRHSVISNGRGRGWCIQNDNLCNVIMFSYFMLEYNFYFYCDLTFTEKFYHVGSLNLLNIWNVKKKHTLVWLIIPPSVLDKLIPSLREQRTFFLKVIKTKLTLAIIRNYETLTSRELKVYPKYWILINKNELKKKVLESVMATVECRKTKRKLRKGWL